MYGHHSFDGIDVIALDRLGGVSEGNFASLNLAQYVGDDASHVTSNIVQAASLVHANNVAVLRAEHGNTVNVVGAINGVYELGLGDAAVTRERGVALLALSADCVAGALVDPKHNVIGVFHAGWKGVLANVVGATWDKMKELGAVATSTHAVLGPSICGNCYEVPAERVDEFRNVQPECIVDDRHLDVAAGTRAQLTSLGIQNVTIPGCTYEDETLFSYRRAHGEPTGRGGLIVCIQERVEK